MKKVWLAIGFAVALIAAVLIPYIIGMGQRMDLRMYDTYLAKYGAECLESGGITAEVDGQTVQVDPARLDEIQKRLTTAESARIPVTEAPADYTARMVLHFGPEAQVELYALDEKLDDTVILADLGGHRYGWKLVHFRVYDWVKRAVMAGA